LKNVEKIDDSRAVGMTEYLRAADAAKKCRREMPALCGSRTRLRSGESVLKTVLRREPEERNAGTASDNSGNLTAQRRTIGGS